MATYNYKGYYQSNPAATVAATIDAENDQQAQELLTSEGIVLVALSEVNTAFNPSAMAKGLTQRVKIGDLAYFTRQLSAMINAGMGPIQALEVTGRGAQSKYLQEVTTEVVALINQGQPMSAAMGQFPKVFNPLYIALIRAGETGGVMQTALLRLADQIEKDAALRREVKSAMVYPVTVMVFCALIFLAMMIKVVPAFQDIFESSGGQLPKLTGYLVKISNFIQTPFGVLTIFFGPPASLFAFKAYTKTDAGRLNVDRLKLQLPVKFGVLFLKVATARFARTMATLNDAGVPILYALEITAPTANNKVIENAIMDARQGIQRGEALSTCIEATGVFPEVATSMLIAGEQAGAIDTMLNKVAETYEDEVESMVKSLKSIMEPVLMVVIGAIVGTVVIGLYLPIFNLTKAIKN